MLVCFTATGIRSGLFWNRKIRRNFHFHNKLQIFLFFEHTEKILRDAVGADETTELRGAVNKGAMTERRDKQIRENFILSHEDNRGEIFVRSL